MYKESESYFSVRTPQKNKFKMNKFLSYIAAVSISLFTFSACTEDYSDVENQILDLTDRVESLERFEDYVYSQIEALELLLSYSTLGTASISSIEQGADGTFYITFSDGTSTEISVELNSEYSSYDTQLRVCEDYWQYSIDGENWYDVLDGAGNKVPAVDMGDSWFATAEIIDGCFVFTLVGDDTVYSIPIVEGFSLIIAGVDYSTPVIFSYGETQSFAVTVDGASVAAVAAVPSGWSAVLEGGILSITSPASASRSLEANTDTDVALMAVSESGFAAVTKMQVQVDPDADKNPTATISVSDATSYTDLTFSVSLSQTTSWYYIFQSSDLSAPDAATLKATEELTTSGVIEITKSDLAMGASYSLYVLPIYEGEPNNVDGAIASCTVSTATIPADQLDYYVHGYTYGGVTYDQNTADVVLIDAASENTIINKGGVYFIDGVDVTLSSGVNITDGLVIIGRYAASRSNVTVAPDATADSTASNYENVVCAGTTDGCDYIFKNISLTNAYITGNGTATINNLVFEDCYLAEKSTKNSLVYFSPKLTLKNIIFSNNFIESKTQTYADYSSSNSKATKALFYSYTNHLIDNIEKFTVTNNTFCSEYVVNYTIFYILNNAGTTNNMDFEVKNNVFYNMISTTRAMFSSRGVKSLSISKNIFGVDAAWTDGASLTASGMVNYLAATDETTYADGFEAKNDILDNVVYGVSADFWMDYLSTTLHTSTVVQTPLSTYEDAIESVDIAGQSIVVKSSYTTAGYGPQE